MNDHPAFEDLIEQYLDQYRNGTAPDIKEYSARYPQYSHDLLEILPLLQDLEGAGHSTPRQTVPSLIIPENIPASDFRLIRKIGQGGMGVVFEALQISLNRKAAVKLLAPSISADPARREDFEREAQVIAMLHHPNIVKIYSAGSCPDCCFYAMELINGKELNQCEFSSIKEIAEVGLQAAEGLAYAHRCKIMHRDIKPSNLLLDENRELHISDFGLAYILRENKEMIEDPDKASGTLRYMAPERIRNGINSFSADQYSLGVTLYELAANRPFLQERTPKEMIRRICEGSVPPLRCGQTDFDIIVNKSISRDPNARYKSMDEFATDLRHFVNNEPIDAVSVSLRRRLLLWTRRKPLAAALSVLSVVSIFAFLTALAVGYVRTSSALKLAQKNADVADTVLSDIFHHVEKQPPSPNGTNLLAALMPYYQGIARQQNLPISKIAETNTIIGICALRTGNYPLAENAYRRLSEIRSDPCILNQLSDSLRKQGKRKEADTLSRQIAETCSDSDNLTDRYETARALKALSADPQSKEMFQAFQIIQNLLRLDPNNAEYRFQYAVILGSNPRQFHSERISGIEPNAVILLNQLNQEYPDHSEYGLALVELMYQKLRFAQSIKNRDRDDFELALDLSNQLLGRFPNTPSIVASTVRFREAYANVLRRSGQETEARRETERLLGILEILFYSPEIPDSAKESLIHLQFLRAERLLRDGRTQEVNRVSDNIKRELNQYNGTRLDEFQLHLKELSKSPML
ncbi:MAG: protein kinase [Planctomycetia bacterium]|nr:protein kinase [Planctomycetia bacterium]